MLPKPFTMGLCFRSRLQWACVPKQFTMRLCLQSRLHLLLNIYRGRKPFIENSMPLSNARREHSFLLCSIISFFDNTGLIEQNEWTMLEKSSFTWQDVLRKKIYNTIKLVLTGKYCMHPQQVTSQSDCFLFFLLV